MLVEAIFLATKAGKEKNSSENTPNQRIVS